MESMDCLERGGDYLLVETRSALWVSDLAWRDRPLRQHWPKLAGVGRVERRREINGKIAWPRSFGANAIARTLA